jgi:hypothetical protein
LHGRKRVIALFAPPAGKPETATVAAAGSVATAAVVAWAARRMTFFTTSAAKDRLIRAGAEGDWSEANQKATAALASKRAPSSPGQDLRTRTIRPAPLRTLYLFSALLGRNSL